MLSSLRVHAGPEPNAPGRSAVVTPDWQSEFREIIGQVAGLAYLLHVGSPQSPEGNERMEAKLDTLLRRIDPGQAEKLISDLDTQYPRK